MTKINQVLSKNRENSLCLKTVYGVVGEPIRRREKNEMEDEILVMGACVGSCYLSHDDYLLCSILHKNQRTHF